VQRRSRATTQKEEKVGLIYTGSTEGEGQRTRVQGGWGEIVTSSTMRGKSPIKKIHIVTMFMGWDQSVCGTKGGGGAGKRKETDHD